MVEQVTGPQAGGGGRRRERSRSSLSTRIAVTGAALAFVMVIATLLTNWFVLQRTVRRETEEASRSLAVLLASNISPALASNARESVHLALAGLFQVDEVTCAAVTTSEGKVYAQMGDLSSDLRLDNAGTTEVDRRGGLLVVHVPVRDADEKPLGTFHLGYSLAVAKRHLAAATAVLLLEGLLLTLAAFLVGHYQARRMTGPLLELAGAVRKLGRNQRPNKLEVRSRDEVGQVIQAFNELTIRIRRYRRQITRQKRRLERAVQERTAELRRKNLELAVQNEQVREVSRLKSDFLANMSHELRTPLNAILALSELLRDEVTGPLSNPEQRTQAAMIYQSGETLLRLINDVLDLSKIEAGRMEIRFARTDVEALLRTTVDEIRPLADRKGLTLTTAVDVSGALWIDPDRVHQVLYNLIGNAIKFTDRGTVEVRARADEERETLAVSVADTGVGIAPQDHEGIFQEFRQVDGSATRRYGGTGLGLAISRRLVRLMGGDISLASDLGQGAVFTFHVPACREAPADAVRPVQVGPRQDAPRPAGADRTLPATGLGPAVLVAAGSTTPRREIRVLVVDDDPAEIEAVTCALVSEGLDVHVAANGAEALHEVERLRPDLVVLDLMMPGMSGFEVLDRLARTPGRPLVPIVVNTAKELTRDEWAALEGRVDRIVSKGRGGVRLLVEEIQRLVENLEAEAPAEPPGGEREVA